jgi:hypothetical protein
MKLNGWSWKRGDLLGMVRLVMVMARERVGLVVIFIGLC